MILYLIILYIHTVRLLKMKGRLFMDISKVFGIIKIPAKYYFGISFITGIMLFSPNNILNKLGLQVFVKDNRTWIGVIFLITLGFWVTDFLIHIYKKVNKSINIKRNTKIRKERLHNLTQKEKSILSVYIDNNIRSQKLDSFDGTVRELENYKIIYRASNVGTVFGGFSYNIQP
ncbi:MAG: hypothetical protein FH762_18335 [Firmicutes bacterium]|nr:hypothetical protein [Bacillota bacterium]